MKHGRMIGFVPAYNAASTIGETISSLRAQSPFALEVHVIDDASTDNTAAIASQAGAQVYSMPENSGRGAVRAKGIELLEAEFIVSIDSGNRISPDFVAQALPLFEDPKVGAVVGHWSEKNLQGVSQRWRARHLFRAELQPKRGMPCHLATHGCILRRSAILAAGNFNPALRHTEDAVLGYKMQMQGLQILSCPESKVEPQKVDRLPQLARRYWRWHAGARERWSLKRYYGHIKNSLLVMLPLDWKARDIPALIVTLLMPHWLTFYTLKRKIGGKSKP